MRTTDAQTNMNCPLCVTFIYFAKESHKIIHKFMAWAEFKFETLVFTKYTTP